MDFTPKLHLWRKAVALFHANRNREWEGPFYSAGFKDYRIERLMFDDGANERTPDMVTSDGERWAILELTQNPTTKDLKVEKYRRIQPESLSNLNLPRAEKGPFVLVGRPEELERERSPQVILGDVFDLRNEDGIGDSRLKSSLQATIGRDLSHLPEISITLIPEAASPEIRRALVPMVLGLFHPDRPLKTSMDFVNEGLDCIASLVSPQAKTSLRDKIETEMKGLIEGSKPNLEKYLEREGRSYRAKRDVTDHRQTLNKVGDVLKNWAGGETRLPDFL